MYVMRNSEEISDAYGFAETAHAYAAPVAGPLGGYAPDHLGHVAHSGGSAQHQQISIQQNSSSAGSFGPLFRELRRALGLTLPTAASFSGTRIDVIVALERGDLSALPPWPETVQVVSRLTGLAQIDPNPVLALIYQEMSRSHYAVADAEEATARSVQPVMGTPLPTMVTTWTADDADAPAFVRNQAQQRSRIPPPPPARAHDDESTLLQRGKDALGGLIASARGISGTGRMVVLSAVLIAAGGTIAQGSAFRASLATLQTPIERLLRGAESYLIWRSAPVKDGLRWISVEDPRSRRGDKLKVKPSV